MKSVANLRQNIKLNLPQIVKPGADKCEIHLITINYKQRSLF